MSDIIPLQIYPWPVSDEQLGLVKEAKAGVHTDVKVLPTRAVPGLHARVLALGSLPPWVCDAAFVKDCMNVESITAALDWLLNAPPESDRGFMVKDYLEAMFGSGVEELPPPSCQCMEQGCEDLAAVREYEPLEGRCEACFEAGCYLAKGLCLRD